MTFLMLPTTRGGETLKTEVLTIGTFTHRKQLVKHGAKADR